MESPVPLKGWQKYFNSYTTAGRRNVSYTAVRVGDAQRQDSLCAPDCTHTLLALLLTLNLQVHT